MFNHSVDYLMAILYYLTNWLNNKERNEGNMGKVTPFLTFSGNAEEAMNIYTSIFRQSEIKEIIRYGKGEVGREGTVHQATFIINDQTFMCSDSVVKHEWSFTPGISLFVACESNQEIENAFHELSKEGQVLMPLDSYPFSEKFAWIDDKFGVSWQLNLNSK
ncbi:VOC family protein [Virgibacillus salarius]